MSEYGLNPISQIMRDDLGNLKYLAVDNRRSTLVVEHLKNNDNDDNDNNN